MPITDKKQLNLLVEPETCDEYRELARLKGYGKRTCLLLADLLAVYRPDYQALQKRLQEAFKKQPALTAEDVQSLQLLHGLIAETLASVSPHQ